MAPGPASAPAPEQTILRVRRHGRYLTLPVLLLIALAGAAGYYVGNLPESWMNWAAGLGALALALLLGITPIFSWLSNRTTITNKRIIVREGLLVHRRSEVPLSRVREVRSKRRPLQRLFGTADIELMVGPETQNTLRDVPSPAIVIDALHELIELDYQRGPETAVGGPIAGQLH